MTTSLSKEAAPVDHLRILCFGDSLTSGYTSFGLESYPYGDYLQERLSKLLATTPSRIVVNVDGMPGDQVRGAYMRRIQRHCGNANAQPYDWIVIMGGTNDLGWGQSPKDIFEGLKSIWNQALRTGAKVLALNVIEAAESSERGIRNRNALNKMIAEYQSPQLYKFDLGSVIRYSDVDEATRDEVWDDGLHLTEHGYKIMGRAIAARIHELLSNTQADHGVNV